MKKLTINDKRGKGQPIYAQIADHLRGQIVSGAVENGQHLPSMSEMMQSWDVAYPTLKNAFDILEKERLIKCSPGRGRGPMVIAAPEKQEKKTQTFGFLRWTSEAQFIAIENGIRRFAAEQNISVSVLDASHHSGSGLELVGSEAENVDGFILYPWDVPEYRQTIEKFLADGQKFVFVDRMLLGLPVSSVALDNFSGACLATNHLIETHNLPVYYFGIIEGLQPCWNRHRGWNAVMREHFAHIDFDESYLWSLPFSEGETMSMRRSEWERQSYNAVFERLSGCKDEVICVFAFNADAGRILCSAAEDAGRKVGVDFFVACFGDKPFCERMPVPMTAVRQCDETLGYEAAKLLRDELLDSNRENVHRIVPVELVVRASSVGFDS